VLSDVWCFLYLCALIAGIVWGCALDISLNAYRNERGQCLLNVQSKAPAKSPYKLAEDHQNDNVPMNSSTKVLKAILEQFQLGSKMRVVVPF
ncbi:MAG: hypothetical protein WA901_15390, partial [Phormidesmis sp.]